ncbi:hypothetical protein K501DRAFT_333974 [Backusella circina FSU 941]|nr:hypothetical protein K501DRAFT_333974 [Backusella circina FSU 941]
MSLTSAPNPLSSDLLQFNVNDSALDLLNAAIASHKQESNEESETNADEHTTTGKRVHAKDDTPDVAPKRAGRKPLNEPDATNLSLDPKQKRKAQNRAAQRAFRDRKEKHVSELQARIDELEKLNETKDETLLEENKQLKEMLKKLQDENYALKGAQFTFKFPPENNDYGVPFHPTLNTPPVDVTTFTSGSSMSSGNSITGEESTSSSEYSPVSKSHETVSPTTDSSNSVQAPPNQFSTDLLQFGLLPPSNNTSNATTANFDFLAVSGNEANTNEFPQVDLFHGKDNLYTGFADPNNLSDDFLFANEDLTNLFANDSDLFGFDTSFSNDTSNLFNLNNNSSNGQQLIQNLSFSRKLVIYEKIKKAKEEGRRIYDLHKEIVQDLPELNIDALCDQLKSQAKCSDSTEKVNDCAASAYVKLLDSI